ncbi:trans-sialidase [Trypanosoma theileri]|uniref:Trans-sialidase n=1 Tax=Trypanosoma theileri TaxID=67003 RepID=A0A1X0NG35_9TRYP|nr:trans-sialidase [Trypanosoma theileri]ORC83734.1 trans-sialidase [Trypanosoma theileri]
MLGCISGYAQGEEPQEKTTLLRTFNGSHILELENGQLVAINGANLYRWNGSQREYMELLTPASSEGENALLNTDRNLPRLYSYGYNVFLMRYGSGTSFRAVFALVESNDPPSEKYSVLRIVWMNTLNGIIEKNSLIHTPLILRFPIMKGEARVVRFLANTSTPILTTKNNTLLFPVQFVTEDNKVFSTVMYYWPHDTKWNIGGALPDMDTYNPAILEWENDNLIMITQHTSGYHRVYESTDLGDTWKESTSTLSRVWANSPIQPGRGSQNNFITATIGEKRVILFTQSVETEEENELHLWVTDKTHIYHAGLIVKDKKVKSSTLLFKDDKLYCLYEASKEEGKYEVLFVDLTNKVKEIKEVLNTWDTITSNGICCTDEACTSFDCRISPTKLVGYLSETIDEESNWKDEYLGVDASVSGTVKKNPNGFTFMGIGAGAMWPVSTDELARQYHFTNYAFTLVATVAIHAAPKKGSSPLLGVSLKNTRGEILLGLSYNKNKTWSTIHRNVVQASDNRWEVDRTYTVVLTFANSDCSVQIDGDPMGFVKHNFNRESEEISHFYFGSDGEAGDSTFATVTNIMLYNGVLTPTEIDALIKKKLVISLSESVKQMLTEEIKMQSTLPTPATSSTAGPQSIKKPQNTNSGNQTIDGTVRIYESVLSMLLLGLWALATVLP